MKIRLRRQCWSCRLCQCKSCFFTDLEIKFRVSPLRAFLLQMTQSNLMERWTEKVWNQMHDHMKRISNLKISRAEKIGFEKSSPLMLLAIHSISDFEFTLTWIFSVSLLIRHSSSRPIVSRWVSVRFLLALPNAIYHEIWRCTNQTTFCNSQS